MNEYLEKIPCDKVIQILESVYDFHERFGEPLDGILNAPFSIKTFLESQTQEDDLTKLIFQEAPNGMVYFPLAGRNNEAEPYCGHIGDQTSKYHQESIEMHLYGDMARMYQTQGYEPKMMLATLLHDAMKKYTAGTNKRGEVCFYGHEKVSAYYAAKVFEQLGYSKEEARPYITMIHGHMLPLTDWKNPQYGEENERRYEECYGAEQKAMVEAFTLCDAGVKQGEDCFRYSDGYVMSVEDAEKTGKAMTELLSRDIDEKKKDLTINNDIKGENIVLRLNELAEKIGNEPREVVQNGTTKMSVNWDAPTAQKALAEAYPLSATGEKVVIDGPTPAWFASALTHVVHPCPVALHDPKVGDIDIPHLAKGEPNPAGELAFNVQEGKDGVLLSFSIDNGTVPPVYDYNNLKNIVVPEIPEGKPLYIDGKGPNYIAVALGEAYAHTQPSVSYHQTQLHGYVCGITHVTSFHVGEFTPDEIVNERVAPDPEIPAHDADSTRETCLGPWAACNAEVSQEIATHSHGANELGAAGRNNNTTTHDDFNK